MSLTNLVRSKKNINFNINIKYNKIRVFVDLYIFTYFKLYITEVKIIFVWKLKEFYISLLLILIN